MIPTVQMIKLRHRESQYLPTGIARLSGDESEPHRVCALSPSLP